ISDRTRRGEGREARRGQRSIFDFFLGGLGGLGILAFLSACGPKVRTDSWIERETELGRSHAGARDDGADAAAKVPVHIDLSTLDAATIDELDFATARAVLDQLGDRRPAARVALRAARLAHHRGDDAEARALLARAASAAD